MEEPSKTEVLAKQHAMTHGLLKIESVKGKVDFAVITIRQDEYQAVLERLPDRTSVVGGTWYYEYGSIQNKYGEHIRVAVARTSGPGHGAAQQTAYNIVADLSPKWMFLVGIAGGFPNDDFSLGDVVLAYSLIDLSITAANPGGGTEYTVRGGPCHPDVERLLSWLPSQNPALRQWNSMVSLVQARPHLEVPKDSEDCRLYGAPEHKIKVARTLQQHFSTQRAPLFATATLATSNTLVKDATLVRDFRSVSRDVEHVEMEAGGVYRVCHQNCLPFLCIRGISDVVGFKRGPEWTQFACHTAAAFFQALVRTLPRDAWGKSLANTERRAKVRAPLAFAFGRIASALQSIGAALSVSNPTISRSKRKLPSFGDLRKRISEVSSGLLQFELPEDDRIDFDVEDEICNLSENDNVTLLLGRPGSGKTSLLAKVGNKFVADGLVVLAIKADMFPHDKSFDEWAAAEIGYDLTFSEVVQSVAASEKIVVLVDQLDALANTADLTSSRLNELLCKSQDLA